MATHRHAQPRATPPAPLLGELQGAALEAHDIVAADEPLALLGQELIEVHGPAEWDKGARGIGRRARELRVVVRKELVAQIGIGRLKGGDPRDPEFVDEAPLEGAVQAFDPAAGLRRVAGNVLDAEAGEDPADDGEVGAIHGASGRGRVKGPAGPIGVEGHRQPERREDPAQGSQDGLRGLLRPERGVEQPLGGVVEHGDERLALPGTPRQPLMVAPVDVQELAEAGAGRTTPAMAAAGAPRGHQAGRLKGEFHKRVGERHAVIPPGEIEEVTDIEALVARAIELQHPLGLRAGRRAVRRPPPPAVEQPQDRILLISGAPAPQAARMNAQDVGRLEPGPGAGYGPHDPLLVGHGPLHGGGRKLHEHLLGCSWVYRHPPEKRTLHVLSGADRLCAPYKVRCGALTRWRPHPRIRLGISRRTSGPRMPCHGLPQFAGPRWGPRRGRTLTTLSLRASTAPPRRRAAPRSTAAVVETAPCRSGPPGGQMPAVTQRRGA